MSVKEYGPVINRQKISTSELDFISKVCEYWAHNANTTIHEWLEQARAEFYAGLIIYSPQVAGFKQRLMSGQIDGYQYVPSGATIELYTPVCFYSTLALLTGSNHNYVKSKITGLFKLHELMDWNYIEKLFGLIKASQTPDLYIIPKLVLIWLEEWEAANAKQQPG